MDDGDFRGRRWGGPRSAPAVCQRAERGVATFAARPAYEAALRVENMGRAGDLSAATEALTALAQEVEHLRPALTHLAERAGSAPSGSQATATA
jgi:hypothetical protein